MVPGTGKNYKMVYHFRWYSHC